MNYKHLHKYYNGKKVFLTGHTGFKGAWLLQWLKNIGAEVKGYSLAPQNKNDLYNLINGDSLCESVIANILDKKKLESELLSFEPDFIFHLAAQPLVRLSYEIPTETFEVNAIGTANILDAVRLLTKKCTIICITTDKVYENKEWPYPYRESDRLGGYDPYSASKACAELIIGSYRNSFFNSEKYDVHLKSVASARAGNVIGGGDWSKDRIIPDIVRSLNENSPVHVRNPKSVRPWQHVLEPIGGYLHLGTKMIDDPIRFSESWNFGPLDEDNLTVTELVKKAVQYWGMGSYTQADLQNQPHEAGLLKLDINKTVKLLDWKPKFNSSQAIEKTLEWYHSYISNNLDLSEKQIKDYLN